MFFEFFKIVCFYHYGQKDISIQAKSRLFINGINKTGFCDYGTCKYGVSETGVCYYGICRYGVSETGVCCYGICKYGVSKIVISKYGVVKNGISIVDDSNNGFLNNGVSNYGLLKGGVSKNEVLKNGVLEIVVVSSGVSKSGFGNIGLAKSGIWTFVVCNNGVANIGISKTVVLINGVMFTGLVRIGIAKFGILTSSPCCFSWGRMSKVEGFNMAKKKIGEEEALRQIKEAINAPRSALKMKITTMIDIEVLEKIKDEAHQTGMGYQTLINQKLRDSYFLTSKTFEQRIKTIEKKLEKLELRKVS